jgi:hypothetical protein|eukprot:SAG11_NODE_757_length_7322_cov_32.976603_6_plen_45_part_00
MNEGVRWNYKEFRSYDEAELTLEVSRPPAFDELDSPELGPVSLP